MEAVRRQTPDDGFYTTEMVFPEGFYLHRSLFADIPENAVTVYTGMSARKVRRLLRDSYPSKTRPKIRHLVVTGKPARYETEDDWGWRMPVREFRTGVGAWLYRTALNIKDKLKKHNKTTAQWRKGR